MKDSEGSVSQGERDREWHDREIDLIDAWLVISRRKWIVIVVFVLSVLISLVAIFQTPAQYKDSALIEIGEFYAPNQTPDSEAAYLESPSSLIARLNNSRVANRIAGTVSADVEGGRRSGVENILVIRAFSRSAEDAHFLLTELLGGIESDHLSRYSTWLDQQNQLIQQARSEITDLEVDIKRLGRLSEKLFETEPGRAAMIEIERAHMRERLMTVHEDISEREFSLANSTRTRILRHPQLPKRPVAPQPKKYVSVGIVLGLFLGVLVAFVVEFFSKVKVRKIEEAG